MVSLQMYSPVPNKFQIIFRIVSKTSSHVHVLFTREAYLFILESWYSIYMLRHINSQPCGCSITYAYKMFKRQIVSQYTKETLLSVCCVFPSFLTKSIGTSDHNKAIFHSMINKADTKRGFQQPYISLNSTKKLLGKRDTSE